MDPFAAIRRGGALALAGSLVFGLPVLLAPVLAPSWGSGPSLVAVLLAINLVGGAIGAWMHRVSGWSAAGLLAVVLVSPWTSWALGSASALGACALVLVVSVCTGRWTVDLLADPPGSRTLWYALETMGGGLGVLALLAWGFPHLELSSLARLAGALAFVGSLLSFRQRGPAGPSNASSENVPWFRRIRPAPVQWLAAWSGFQFFHSQTAWTHHFAQIHANSFLSFGVVALSLLVGLPLGSLLARRMPSLWLLALGALGGLLLLPLLQGTLVARFGTNAVRDAFPWDLLLSSLGVLVPTSAAIGMLYPWLLGRLEKPGSVPGLVVANLMGGFLGALVAGFATLPLMGLHASLCMPAIGWAAIAIWNGPSGAPRWWVALVGCVLVVAGWDRWNAPLAPRADYVVLDRQEGWSGRVELVNREGHDFLLYNGSYALGGTRSIASQSWQAGLALALRPHAREVFVLGMGTGITAGALTRSTEIRRARVVELLPQVVDLARSHFGQWTGPLFSDPRFSIEVGDARTTLRDDPGRYDLVLGDLFLPWLPGAELLMGQEHLVSVRDHLRPGGLYVQWLPLYQLTEPVFNDILATARSVFGEVHLFREDNRTGAPMIALVAGPPGTRLADSGASALVLENWTGKASDMVFLDGRHPWTHDNRLMRGMRSGGINPGQPSAALAMAGSRYQTWVSGAMRTESLDRDADFAAFGPQAWRRVAHGYLRMLELSSRQAGDFYLADTFASRARAFETENVKSP